MFTPQEMVIVKSKREKNKYTDAYSIQLQEVLTYICF